MANGNVVVSPMMQFVRVSLMLFTAVFWITGFCLFVIGIWSVVELNKYDELPSSNNYNSAAAVLIVIGLLIACVGFCGCFGAMRKNICLLKTFAVFLGLVVLCEVCVAVAGYAYRSKIKDALSNGLNTTMQDYIEGGVIKQSWDKMQENGCYDLITNFFQSKFSILASGALGVALVQIIGVICSGCLWTHIKNKTNYELV